MIRAEARDFWRSAGLHLVARTGDGWLAVTPDYLRAYLTRPEIHPIEASCPAEHALFEALMADPFRPVLPHELEAIRDPDAADNYRILLRFRDLLAAAGTLEAAYLRIAREGNPGLPPLFLDQMLHIILRGLLTQVRDPFRLRAAEIFFREQVVSLDEGRIMLADDEIVTMMSQSGGLGGLGELLLGAGAPLREVTLDVLTEDNKAIYWERSDRFDTVIDFRFTQPALDAFARVLEAFVRHFLRVEVHVEPRASITDEHWAWHIGLDAEASRILNALYEGRPLAREDLARIIALFRLDFRDPRDMAASVRGRPVYLGLAMTPERKLRMKPQNVLANLPLARAS